MSFIGGVAQSVSRIVANIAKSLTGPVLVVGAGNFTTTSALRSGGYKGPVRSCDISCYTSAMGAFLAGNPIDMQERADCPDHLKGLFVAETDLDKVASVSLIYELRDIWEQNNPYQIEVFNQYRARWAMLMEECRRKLEVFRDHVAPIEYEARDGYLKIAEADRDHVVCMCPQLKKNETQRPETLLRAVLDWQQPEYQPLFGQDLELFQQIAEFRNYLVVLQDADPEAFKILGEPMAILPKGMGASTYVFSKRPRKRYVLKSSTKTGDIGPIFPYKSKIVPGMQMAFGSLPHAQTQRMNELFIAARVNYTTTGAGDSIAFTLDGKILGKAVLTKPKFEWNSPDGGATVFLLSSLVVPNETPKLAKLVLMATLAREIKDEVDIHYLEDYRWVYTTVFAKHPVSMTYRGVFKLHSRTKTEEGFKLAYYAPFGQYGIKDVVNLWLKRYGKRG